MLAPLMSFVELMALGFIVVFSDRNIPIIVAAAILGLAAFVEGFTRGGKTK